jgi:thiol-disulfide isomerase/thioredoxin
MLVKGSLNSYCLTGSLANDLEKEYTRLVKEKVNKERDSLMKEYRFMRDTRRGDQKSEDDLMTRILLLDDVHYKVTYDFVSKHSDNMFSAYAACAVLYGRYEQAKAIYDLLGTGAQTSVFGLDLKNRVDDLARAAIGNICPDFTVVDTVGNETVMKSLLKTIFADKLVVIDFWASWCGPCRQEMKNLRGLYEEFSDQGVRFMSVSVDDNEAKWRKAYGEEKIPWINTWDKGGWANASVRKAFGFRQIPYIILLDREGKVVAQNVRRNTLREKIIEQLKR